MVVGATDTARPPARFWLHGLGIVVAALLVLPSPAHLRAEAEPATYLVQPGDNLTEIAARTGVDANTLLALNHLDDPNLLVPGMVLQLPAPAQPPDAAATTDAPSPGPGADASSGPAPAAPPAGPTYVYVVQQGDTLFAIARRLGVTPDVILGMNSIADPNQIQAGTELTLPGSLQPSPPAPVGTAAPAPTRIATPVTSGSYVVQPGDTLFGIARRYGITTDELVAANGLTTADYIVAGQVLALPADASASTSATPAQPAVRSTPTVAAAPPRPTAVPTTGAPSTGQGGASASAPSPGASASSAAASPRATATVETSTSLAVQLALQYVGAPYLDGGASPAGFDAAGFIAFVETRAGRLVPRDLVGQYNAGPHPSGALLPGDLVFFQDTPGSGPVDGGIYVGNAQFIHALDAAQGVSISTFTDPYWFGHWFGATRLA